MTKRGLIDISMGPSFFALDRNDKNRIFLMSYILYFQRSQTVSFFVYKYSNQ